MTDRVIWPQPGGPIAVLMPFNIAPQLGPNGQPAETPREALLRHARQVVPAGTPFRVVDASVIPADRSLRSAWTADFSAPDGIGEFAP
jgi:hypothetical protein